jgi:single-strand DNA-binding protein
MNKVVLLGRLTAKPELRYTSSNTAYTRFTVAVNRRQTKEDGTRDADFITVVAWRRTAEIISQYFDKGSQICIDGNIRTGSYDDQNGNRRYTTEVFVDNFDFIDSKNSRNSAPVPDSPYDYQQPSPATAPSNNSVDVTNDPFAEFGDNVSIDEDFLD